MTITHVSHFGISAVQVQGDSVVLTGTLAGCRKIAFAHGLEVVRAEGQIVGCEGGKAITNAANVMRYLLSEGMIQRLAGNQWALVMPAEIYNEKLY